MADATPPPNPSRRKLFSWLVDRDQAGQIGAETGKIVRQAKEIAEDLKYPVRDLVPVCPNCHAVIHLRREGVYGVEEVRAMLGRPRH